MNTEIKTKLAWSLSYLIGIDLKHRRKCKVIAFAMSQNEGFTKYVLETKFKKA
jgi:hypothetical protein